MIPEDHWEEDRRSARATAPSGRTGANTVDEAARRHGASVEQDTTKPDDAYASVAEREATRYREGWLPG